MTPSAPFTLSTMLTVIVWVITSATLSGQDIVAVDWTTVESGRECRETTMIGAQAVSEVDSLQLSNPEVFDRTVIGKDSHELGHDLYRVRTVRFLSDDNVAVANAGSNSIRIFDKDGTLSKEIGGAGRRPGEFESLGGIWPLRNGSIVAFDVSLNRLSVIDPVKNSVNIYTLRRDGRQMLRYRPVWISANGDVIVEQRRVLSAYTSQDAFRLNFALQRAELSGEVGRKLRNVLGVRYKALVEEGSNRFIRIPFSGNPSARLVRGTLYYYDGVSDAMIIQEGNEVDECVRLQAASERQLIDEGAKELMAEHRVEGIANSVQRKRRRQMLLEDVPWPDRMPSFHGFLVSEDQAQLWIADYDPFWTQRPHEWKNVDLDGNIRRKLLVPNGERLVDIRKGNFTTIWSDSLGVEYVAIYRMR